MFLFHPPVIFKGVQELAKRSYSTDLIYPVPLHNEVIEKCVFFFFKSLLVSFKSFLLNRAVRSKPVKEMRWLTGIPGYTLMRMVRHSWLAVKVPSFSLSIK